MILGHANRQHGATLVEAAIVLPVFIILFFGAFALGHVMIARVALEDSLRMAGRAASTRSFDPLATAQALFSERSGKWGFSPAAGAVSGACVMSTSGSRNLVLSAHLSTSCLFCKLFPTSSDGTLRLNATYASPLEDPGAVC